MWKKAGTDTRLTRRRYFVNFRTKRSVEGWTGRPKAMVSLVSLGSARKSEASLNLKPAAASGLRRSMRGLVEGAAARRDGAGGPVVTIGTTGRVA